jgi:hypothetical protein
MIINGKKIKGPNVEVIVIPREPEDIVFKAQAVLDFDNFGKLCPTPKPPRILKRGVGLIENVEDHNYKIALEQHASRRLEWLIIESLKATENLQWERVDYSKPETWELYKDELKESGFGEYEINRIIRGVMIANSLDESKLEEARKRFLVGQEQEQAESSSQNGERKNTRSGELVNDSK